MERLATDTRVRLVSILLSLLAIRCPAGHGQSTTVNEPSMPSAVPVTEEELVSFCLREEGDREHGRELFGSERLLCHQCHTVDGTRGKLGPDLAHVGDKFGRREILQAIMNPSAAIADGYEQTIVQTNDGHVYTGLIKQASLDWTEMVSFDGVPVRIALSDIEERHALPTSFMPQGIHRGLSPSELNDVVEYLVSLKQPQTAHQVSRGMPHDIPALSQGVAFVPILPQTLAFSGPVWMMAIPDSPGDWLVLEHATKKIWHLAGHPSTAEPHKSVFLELPPSPLAEGRLACLAFHPDFHHNRKYYVYDRDATTRQLFIVISERLASEDGRTDSGAAPREILRVPQSTLVHFGGWLAFGPDGYLYVSLGDSGPQEDPLGNAQSHDRLLGKLLRIDVRTPSHDKPYSIPSDNPFLGHPTIPPEVWASGFRAPWRCSFDRVTGDLWVGDVGQDRYEEVALVRRGENHGWNVYEGFLPFSNQYRRQDELYTPPVFAYARRYGPSITGGYVLRTHSSSPLEGKYICGDFESRRLFALTHRDRELLDCRQIGIAPQRLVSFAEGLDGALYVVGFEGMIYRLDPSQVRWE